MPRELIHARAYFTFFYIRTVKDILTFLTSFQLQHPSLDVENHLHAFVIGLVTPEKSVEPNTDERLLAGHIDARRLGVFETEFGQNKMRQAFSTTAPNASNEKPKKKASIADMSVTNEVKSYKLSSSATYRGII